MVKTQIAVIGSGLLSENQKEYALAKDLGKGLVDEGYRILCGGLGGVMTAVCEGAKASPNYSEGSTIGILPTLDKDLVNPFVDISIATGLSFARNQVIIASSDIVVSISGGAGTLSELAFAWQLNKPIITLRNTGGWSSKLSNQKIDDSRIDSIISVDTISEVLDLISKILEEK
ncbi:MAG: TIGR00725 family protein [Candidatus Heimdallarchaeota archaeon]|nr:TIGR00725 family protein [Candidatus Heimdallarchaeota archaeon]MCK4877098.1 TIGR00725 family protein [Candidatus Heimdallarchaeota archaeon]